MTEPTHTPHWAWTRWGLAGLGIGFLTAVILVMFLIPHKVTQGIDDAAAMRNILVREVPPGSSVVEAERFMRDQGFSCYRELDASYRNLNGIDYLLCGRDDGIVVFRVWSVAILHQDGKVTDVFVDTGLTGP